MRYNKFGQASVFTQKGWEQSVYGDRMVITNPSTGNCAAIQWTPGSRYLFAVWTDDPEPYLTSVPYIAEQAVILFLE